MGKLNERRKNILQILEKSQLATVTELSEELKVTTETIRELPYPARRQKVFHTVYEKASTARESGKWQ